MANLWKYENKSDVGGGGGSKGAGVPNDLRLSFASYPCEKQQQGDFGQSGNPIQLELSCLVLQQYSIQKPTDNIWLFLKQSVLMLKQIVVTDAPPHCWANAPACTQCVSCWHEHAL